MSNNEQKTKNNERSSDIVLRVDNVSKKFSRSLKRAMWYGLREIFATALLAPHKKGVEQAAEEIGDLGLETEDWRLETRDQRPKTVDRRPGTGDRRPGTEDRRLKTQAPRPPAPDPRTNNQEQRTTNSEPRTKNEEPPPSLRESEFWALKDISFTLRRGECLGLIGNNGAGKSTLLSILSGIYGPTQGRVTVHGRLQALIALGAGFHPMLTGRENILIYGLVLGLKDAEIRSKEGEIVDFSELGEFIDMPVKNYSSGMYVRLGFAVAAHMNPDILLIDEVLAVGDIGFRRKCMEKVHELLAGDRAVMVVSHSLYQIESLCSHVLWMEKGQVRMRGPAREVVRAYRDEDLKRFAHSGSATQKLMIDSEILSINQVELLVQGNPVQEAEIGYGQSFTVRIYFTAKQMIPHPMFNLSFKTRGVNAFECSMIIDGQAPERIDGAGHIDCCIEKPNLLPNQYDVTLFVRNERGTADLIESQIVASFSITSANLLNSVPSSGPYAIGHLMHGQIAYQKYSWQCS